MTQQDSAKPLMTAAHVAVALVAACKITGTKPDKAFEDGNGRPRVMAAAGCMARLGWSKLDAARLFRVHPNRLTPSGQQLARVWAEHLLEISEALSERGLADEVVPAGERFRAPWGPRRVAKPVEASAESKPDEDRTLVAAAARPSRPAADANPVRLTPRPPLRVVSALKPVNERILRWSRQQLALGASLSLLADLFDVDVEALAAGLEPQAVAA